MSITFRWMGPTYPSTKEECSLEGAMYPGQVIRAVLYGGPRGRLRTGGTLFDCVIVHEGFPWIKCCSLQTHRSQRTRSFCLMSTMGDRFVRTLIKMRAALDVVPLACCLQVEKEIGTSGGGEWDNSKVAEPAIQDTWWLTSRSEGGGSCSERKRCRKFELGPRC